MTQPLPCEFSLVRYVPDPVKNEFVNIGVLLHPAASAEGAPTAQVRFTKDWARVRCVDPDADIDMLEAMETEMRRRLLEPASDAPSLMKTIDDSFSHLLQLTAPKAYLAENLAAGMDQLLGLYVDPRREKTRPALSGRAAIARSLRTHFEQARVWDLLRRRIPASDYTRPGDSLKIDCGYRPNGLVRMFHAVSLSTDSELAKVLAFSAPLLRAGVARVESAELELTAIVEPLRNSHGDVPPDGDLVAQYRFGVETMEAQQIRVLTVNDLARVAETARRELRV
ncbi:MAG TPA: DUF3037 domain-containing protein [Acidobacteriaceae bacterium]|jgi:hypothetical protein|nr:DUF3037 domain-containing protein [Acidobacteriaceae bacterium]